MSEIVYGQYNSEEYPLKRYLFNDIPGEIRNVLCRMNETGLVAFRGGLAYILILGEDKYLLKDMDMLSEKKNEAVVINEVSCADIVYVNKNSFGDTVITAFWKCVNEYYKLDVLLCDEMPEVEICEFDGTKMTTLMASYIWRNRIEKIAEKKQRKHNDEKTLNHYSAAYKLGEHLLANKKDIQPYDAVVVRQKLSSAKYVLDELVGAIEADKFVQLQKELLLRETKT